MAQTAKGRFVAYHRVSTAKQGRSGLGLEAQRAAVAAYLNGGPWKLVGEFVEVESGKRADRPELGKALDLCHLIGATLVIAKLDRLTRNVAFMANLMESQVEFVACDNPHASRFTIHILAAVAEHERDQISARTKAALAAAKARGTTLGGYKGGWPGARRPARCRGTTGPCGGLRAACATHGGRVAGRGHEPARDGRRARRPERGTTARRAVVGFDVAAGADARDGLNGRRLRRSDAERKIESPSARLRFLPSLVSVATPNFSNLLTRKPI